MDLRDFAETYLFESTNTELGTFWKDDHGDYHPIMHVTARDAARFGQLYLDEGMYEGTQIVSSDWVRVPIVVSSFRRLRLRCCFGSWWTIDCIVGSVQHGNRGHRRSAFSRAHGQAWRDEKAIKSFYADFIGSLPDE